MQIDPMSLSRRGRPQRRKQSSQLVGNVGQPVDDLFVLDAIDVTPRRDVESCCPRRGRALPRLGA
jgi:hypothetical protein